MGFEVEDGVFMHCIVRDTVFCRQQLVKMQSIALTVTQMTP